MTAASPSPSLAARLRSKVDAKATEVRSNQPTTTEVITAEKAKIDRALAAARRRSDPSSVDLAGLEEKAAQLQARQQRIDQRIAHLKSGQARREDTRRKILVGAVVLAKIEQGKFDEAILRRWLDQALTRDDDRSLFELAPAAGSSVRAGPSSRR